VNQGLTQSILLILSKKLQQNETVPFSSFPAPLKSSEKTFDFSQLKTFNHLLTIANTQLSTLNQIRLLIGCLCLSRRSIAVAKADGQEHLKFPPN
jgi:hypothetical protein